MRKKKKNFIYKTIRYSYLRFLKIRGLPSELSLGLAIGVFVGMLPILGFQSFVSIIIASIFKCNKITATIGVWVTNPISAPFIYSINFMIGKKLTHFFPKVINLSQYLDFTFFPHYERIKILTIGSIMMGFITSIISYYFSYFLILSFRNRVKIVRK